MPHRAVAELSGITFAVTFQLFRHHLINFWFNSFSFNHIRWPTYRRAFDYHLLLFLEGWPTCFRWGRLHTGLTTLFVFVGSNNERQFSVSRLVTTINYGR